MIYQEIDSKKHFATLPPIHVAHPQYWRKGVYTEAWLSEEEKSLKLRLVTLTKSFGYLKKNKVVTLTKRFGRKEFYAKSSISYLLSVL